MNRLLEEKGGRVLAVATVFRDKVSLEAEARMELLRVSF